MQIRVVAVPSDLRAQVKVYAEYRIFSRLASLARRIDNVDVVVTDAALDAPASCAVTANLGAAGRVTAKVQRRQPIEAIDGAAASLADLVARRLEQQTEEGVQRWSLKSKSF